MPLRSPTFSARGFRSATENDALRACDRWLDHREVCLDCKRSDEENRGRKCEKGRPLYDEYARLRKNALHQQRRHGWN